MLGVVHVLFLAGGALQAAAAVLLLRKRPIGPFWALCAVLLTFNGWASFALAFDGFGMGGADPTLGLLYSFGDLATGPLFLALGILAWRGAGRHEWNLGAKAVAAGCALAIASILVILAGGWYTGAFRTWIYEWLQTGPALIGVALVGVRLALDLHGNPEDASLRQRGLLALAYLPVLGTMAGFFAVQIWSVWPDVWRHAPPRFVGSVAVNGAAVAALVILLSARGASAKWGRTLALVLVGCVLFALGESFAQVDALDARRGFTLFFLAAVPIYVVRPVALAFARVPEKAAWAIHDVGAGFFAVALGKLASSLLLGTPLLEFRWPDLAGLAVGLFLMPILWLAPRRLVRSHAMRARPAPRRPHGSRADERLARFLVEQDAAGQPATKEMIEAATGIKENNVAATIRRLEKRLDAGAEPGTFVHGTVHGVRGRKQYRLTPSGSSRLADSLDK